MFGIGWAELLIIAVVATVVVPPRDLPHLMRGFGHSVRSKMCVGRCKACARLTTRPSCQYRPIRQSPEEPPNLLRGRDPQEPE